MTTVVPRVSTLPVCLQLVQRRLSSLHLQSVSASVLWRLQPSLQPGSRESSTLSSGGRLFGHRLDVCICLLRTAVSPLPVGPKVSTPTTPETVCTTCGIGPCPASICCCRYRPRRGTSSVPHSAHMDTVVSPALQSFSHPSGSGRWRLPRGRSRG